MYFLYIVNIHSPLIAYNDGISASILEKLPIGMFFYQTSQYNLTVTRTL